MIQRQTEQLDKVDRTLKGNGVELARVNLRQSRFVRDRSKFRKRYRFPRGMYLIETLVALILGAMMAYALLNMLSETMRLTSASGNRQSADLVAQTILDAVKRTDPAKWQIGSYQLLLHSDSAGQRCAAMSGPALVHPLALGLDIGDSIWNPKSVSNKLAAQVFLDIQPSTSGLAKVAVVTVKYGDGATIEAKTAATLTTLHAKGVNYWP